MKKFLKLFKNPKLKAIIILSVLLFLYTTICAISYAENVSTDIAESVFRLHILANSDSQEDQELKIKVRNALLEYMNSLCSECTSKEEAITLVELNQEKFREIALNTIQQNGYNYDVKINIGNFQFPTKNYGDISLPAGFYDALKVEIGSAQGQNWWCVMFPPLCFVDVTSGIVPEESKENLQDNLGEEEYDIISNTEDSEIVNFKFKIVEFFENLGIQLANN